MKKQIVNYLLEKGIKPQNIGFKYLERAIDISISEFGYVPKLFGNLYKMVANEFGTRETIVERNIRHAIYTSSKETKQFTNKQFIAKAFLDLTVEG